MKKFLLLLLCCSLLLAGCGKKKEVFKTVKEKVDDTLVTINGLKFHLTKDASFEGINYKIIEDFQESNMTKYIQYRYSQEDGTNLLFFRILYYSGQGIDYARNDLGIDNSFTLKDGSTDNIDYKIIEEPRDDGTIHFYFIEKDNNLYVLHFTSKYDIKDFESKVLKSMKF